MLNLKFARLAALPQRFQTFRILRYDPLSCAKPHFEEFTVNLDKCGPMILDVLIHVKEKQDSSLSFRRSCREGICGSCSMNVEGKNVLACLTYIQSSSKPIDVRPLPHTYILKDLVPDISNFFNSHRAVEPWLQRRHAEPARAKHEIFQSRKDRERLDGLYECILCACCSTACPPYWWNEETYLGPAALLQAYRWISDSRDEMTSERLAWLNDSMRLYRCHNIQNCTDACPKHLDPAGAIVKIKALLESGYPPVREQTQQVAGHSISARSGLSMS
jgi:succinate dehydrogenase/fumarate reductase iron-sulfur protein